MINLTVDGSEGASDVDIEMSPVKTLHFDYDSGSWTCAKNQFYELTFDSGSDEYVLTRGDGFTYTFHDSEVANTAGMLKEIADPYGNDWAFSYSGSQLSDIVVAVVVGSDHKVTYSYFTSGDNTGLIQYIKMYKTTTTTDANLIGQIEYSYHDSTSDDYGSEDDLMKVTISRKATNDGDGTLSIEEVYFYRYYKGTYNSSTNPGTDHQIKYVLYPENAKRLNDDKGSPESQSNSDFEDYANIIYEYDNSSWARKTSERLPNANGGGASAGGNTLDTSYTWTANGGSPDLDTWNLHCVADREDDSRVIFDVNSVYNILSWVIQDDKTSPTLELIWHYDYGTSGAEENRLTGIHLPTNCTDYDETSAPYSVTLSSSAGAIFEIDYDFSTDDYDGYPEIIQIKKGTSGTADELIAYARTDSTRPDLVTSLTVYESTGGSDGRTTSVSYNFYDSGGDKFQIQDIDITRPSVSAAKNGPAVGAHDKSFYDKRTGALRWTEDGEGYVRFFAYDTETGAIDLRVVDVNTSSLPTVVDDNWDGVNDGGYGADDTVPYSRSGSGTALNIDCSRERDWLGRTRKFTDKGGMITYYVYKDDEAREYPAWDTSSEDTLLPIRITKTDKDGRPEEVLTLNTDKDPDVTGNEPDGTETYSNTDLASRSLITYDINGQVSKTDRYHNIPSSGDGTRYSNYYRTEYEHDSMGHTEYIIQDVADESSYDREQVTKSSYDFAGRLTRREEGVSDNNHDIAASKPTLNTLVEFFYDDPDDDSTPEQGEGNGTLSWIRSYYGTSAGEYNDTRYYYDWRNRRCVTKGALAPHTLVKYDNLDRITARGDYSSASSLDSGDDPATEDNTNRLTLSKAYYDEAGRVYKAEIYDDPSDSTPADELVTNNYYDRRSLLWAVDAQSTGITFYQYDGARRKTSTIKGTDFDTNKYTSYAPDYPDDDEKIVKIENLTLNDLGGVTQRIVKELNHNDTNGMDTDGSDYIPTFTYNWYDDSHRLTDTAYYGCGNTGNIWEKPNASPAYGSSAPSRSNSVLVTSYSYNKDGRFEKVTNPKAIETLYTYDALGRKIAVTEDYGTGSELNRKTEKGYNGFDEIVQLIHDPDADNTFSNGSWTIVGTDSDQETKYYYENSQNASWVSKVEYPVVETPADDDIVYAYHVDGTVNTKTDHNGSVITYGYDALRRKTQEAVTTVGSYTGGAGSVDSAIRAITWTWDSLGQVEYVTSHTDTSPDTSTWADAANQIKYTHSVSGRLTKEEQEVDGKVDGSTLALEYSYGTDYSTGNYARLNYVEYPNDRKIWYGYTHSESASTFQDDINSAFSRPGQIARDDSGSIGDILAEYDFNGLGRVVRRVHDENTGGTDTAYGNDTKMDLWHDTSGEYAGLDRMGRIKDMKHVEFSGTATDFARRKYTYDRNSNRESIEDTIYKADSQELAYDDLNRLTKATRGILDSNNEVYGVMDDVFEDYNMDLLSNFTATAGGIKFNGTSSNVTHSVNLDNEITSIDRPNCSGIPKALNDAFSSLESHWVEAEGDWSASNELEVDVVPVSGESVLLADADFDIAAYEVDIRFPTSSSTAKAGLLLTYEEDDHGLVVVMDRENDRIALRQMSGGSWGSVLASDSITISETTWYTLHVTRKQRTVKAWIGDGDDTSFSYTADDDFGTGQSGLYATLADIKFDDFILYDMSADGPKFPRLSGSANASIEDVSGDKVLQVLDSTHADEVVVENFSDDDYMVQVDMAMNSGRDASVWVRYVDTNNGYQVLMKSTGDIYLLRWINGKYESAATGTYTTASSVAVKVKVDGTSIEVWVDGTREINTTDSNIDAGGVAFSGNKPYFDDLKIGYDINDDDDIDDAGDYVIVDEDFSSTSVTVTYDDNGNLVDDGTFVYKYDAWNRLVKVQASEDSDVTIQESEYDGIGRRIKKVVTNSGDHDGTVKYYYDGWSIIETRDGSDNLVQQMITGLLYIDELVMIRTKDKGELYIHQDANWNVVAATDLGGHVVERYVYRPYGEFVVHQETSFGDYDGDQDVDTTDRDAYDGSSPTGAERILDLDFDGDVDATDSTLHDSLTQGMARHPGRSSTGVDQVFGHQGLFYDPEIGCWQSRARQQWSMLRRFGQRDTAGYISGMNLYVYCMSNPVRYTDPLGLNGIAHPVPTPPPIYSKTYTIDVTGPINPTYTTTLYEDGTITTTTDNIVAPIFAEIPSVKLPSGLIPPIPMPDSHEVEELVPFHIPSLVLLVGVQVFDYLYDQWKYLPLRALLYFLMNRNSSPGGGYNPATPAPGIGRDPLRFNEYLANYILWRFENQQP